MSTKTVVVQREMSGPYRKHSVGESVEMPSRIAEFWAKTKHVVFGKESERAKEQKAEPAPQPKPVQVEPPRQEELAPAIDATEPGVPKSERRGEPEREHEDMAAMKKAGTYKNREMKARDTSKPSAKAGKRKYQRRDMKSKG
jgi:hypothetical protein